MKHFFYLILITFLTFPIISTSQTPAWTKAAGGVLFDDIVSISNGPDGSVLAMGYFNETVNFDPYGSGFDITSNGSYDVFVEKRNTVGELVWVKRIGGDLFDYGRAMTTDDLGNIYIFGTYANTVDFDPGSGTHELNATDDGNIFMLKLDPNGDLIWCKTTTGSFSSLVMGIDINSDRLSISCAISGDTDFDPGTGEAIETAFMGADKLCIASYNTEGEFLWVKSIQSSGINAVNSLKLTSTNDVFVVGQYSGTMDFDPGVDINEESTIGPDVNGYILNLDDAGNFLWVKTLSSNSNNIYYDIDLNSSNSAIYLSGYFEGSADFDLGSGTDVQVANGNSNHFVQKLNLLNGETIWTEKFGGPGAYGTGNTIVVGASENIYVGGKFSNTVDFNSGSGSAELTTASTATDGFVQSLDSDGNFNWVYTFGGEDFEYITNLTYSSISGITASGKYSGTTDLNELEGGFPVSSNGNEDFCMINFSGTNGLIPSHSEFSWNFFPNPAEHSVQITDLKGKTIVLSTIDGKKISTFYIAENATELDLSHLESGTYLIQVIQNGLTSSKRLVIR